MATRSEILAKARAGETIDTAPVSHVRETAYFEYTASELEQDHAYDSAIDDLRALRSNWKAENEALEALRGLRAKWRAENDRQVEMRLWLESKAKSRRIAARRVDGPEIVTSAPDMSEPVFPLCRPILRGKVGKRRIPALQSFFQAAAIFFCL